MIKIYDVNTGKSKGHTLIDKRILKKESACCRNSHPVIDIFVYLSSHGQYFAPSTLFFLSSSPLPPFQPGIVNVRLRIRQCVRHLSRFYRPITPIATIVGDQKRKERYSLYQKDLLTNAISAPPYIGKNVS